MNTTDKILDILEYIDRHPDKDAMLSDLRMTDTNEFQKLLAAARSAELIDLANDPYIWYREDELEENGYIHADNRLDVDITEIIDHVNRSDRNYIVIERDILSKLVSGETLTDNELSIIHALKNDCEI